ncbi:MAG TPA: excinuclease ABC subunit UvrB [Clostridiaceae bacterium]|nr:excinuclease ABC subunit UvrB [Clostridiaceae bacterium]
MPGVFTLRTDMTPKGDQPEAIDQLVYGIERGDRGQTLLGVTGSGKTFTMASVIERTQRPALIIAHNKTLAGQLTAEFMNLFPDNAVEYFVSYYDYYQPEAYIPSRDLYIEKDAQINDEIDRLRHKATSSLLERRDVIVVASVSCIYGLGDPEDYKSLMVSLRPGMVRTRESVIEDLVRIQYVRNDYELKRGTFRVRGDTLDIFPASEENRVTRVSFFGDEIEEIREIDAISGRSITGRNYVAIFPASHYATTTEKMKRAVLAIGEELEERLKVLRGEGKLIEAYRLEQRTRYDMDMMIETGFCKGIENYSRHLTGREEGQPPFTLMDFFPEDYLLFIDESHVTVPQIGAMVKGDRSRKESLVEYGFRLPSAFDNRPLTFDEFNERAGQILYVSATPAPYELKESTQIVEQLIRPTGLLDPLVFVRPSGNQMEDIAVEIRKTTENGERSLVLTLTKRFAETLADYFKEEGMRVEYLHSDIATVERLAILRKLRAGDFDVLIGINLLREGLDLPEVSLIIILDADKQGFLRSTTSLVQIIGRAARNVNGRVILYGDEITASMERAISETNRRRDIQHAFNVKHGITPTTIKKEIHDLIDTTFDMIADDELDAIEQIEVFKKKISKWTYNELQRHAKLVEKEMRSAAARLEFEIAAILRDQLIVLKGEMGER